MLALLLATVLVGADFEVECPDAATHPDLAIVTIAVPPPPCGQYNWPLTDAEKKQLGDEKVKTMTGPEATVGDFWTHPPKFKDGKPNPEKPVLQHLIKSVSPCGCVAKHDICACIPNGVYKGMCEADYATDEAKKKGVYDHSVCIYAIKCPPSGCCPGGKCCPAPKK